MFGMLNTKQNDAVARELDACRKAGELVRLALLEDLEDLSAKLADAEERVALGSRGDPEELDRILRRGVHAVFHEEQRNEVLKAVAPAIRAGEVSQADAVRLFVALQDAQERLAEAEKERLAREDEHVEELREAAEAADGSAAQATAEAEIISLKEEVRESKKIRGELAQCLDDAAEEREVWRERHEVLAARLAPLEGRGADRIAELEGALALAEKTNAECLSNALEVQPILTAWTEVLAPMLRKGTDLDARLVAALGVRT